jgi:hypothetical protein
MTKPDEEKEDKHWHLDKRVPLAILLAIFLQTAGVFYWGGQLETRVSNIEARLAQTQDVSQRMSRLEEGISWIKQAITQLQSGLNDRFTGVDGKRLERRLERLENK